MRLSEFEGYGDKMEQLMRSVQAGRIVHALLLTGPHGSGKRTMARLLAQAALCRGIDRPCGVCPACKRFLAGTHPDVRTLRPEKSIGVDEIRDLTEYLSLKPFEGGKHIAIIERADRMTSSAQNALLKTLESPSGDAMFFLVSDAPGAILPTIRSRCQTVRFSDLSVEDCARVLCRRGIEPDRAERLAGMAQGSVGRALELDGDEAFMALREAAFRSLEALRDRASVAAAAALLKTEKGGEAQALDILELLARDVLACQCGAQPYQAQDAQRLSRLKLNGQALLKGVVGLRMQLASNVSWQNALENMYFNLIQRDNNGRTVLSWQR